MKLLKSIFKSKIVIDADAYNYIVNNLNATIDLVESNKIVRNEISKQLESITNQLHAIEKCGR